MIPIPVMPAAVAPHHSPRMQGDDVRLRDAARQMEATFLSEMLKYAGFDTARGGFDGGDMTDGFASFLREAQAGDMVDAGGIGLAETLFNAMKARADA
ncbi:Rod binding protein [Loktanella fryxellensis]|uniref:Rod binding protein n=2 Tax=Loktanella fryxellensis TaxID=245187 RepID=A0A1H7ZRP1_9RHOB|nr:Rod binding protein [Loktanella fryxellensis]